MGGPGAPGEEVRGALTSWPWPNANGAVGRVNGRCQRPRELSGHMMRRRRGAQAPTLVAQGPAEFLSRATTFGQASGAEIRLRAPRSLLARDTKLPPAAGQPLAGQRAWRDCRSNLHLASSRWWWRRPLRAADKFAFGHWAREARSLAQLRHRRPLGQPLRGRPLERSRDCVR